MWSFALLIFLFQGKYELELHHVKKGPNLDGRMEELWNEADFSSNFVQIKPDEGKPPSYKTTVYVLGTDDALYVAFRCVADEITAFLQTWDEAKGDGVQLYLDTFGDRRTGYFFSVNARGVQKDGIIYEDGRTTDFSWDGIWYASSRIYDWGYVVEIKIPYRSIRYTEGLKAWGIDFSRYISKGAEEDFWAPMKINEGLRVSRFGILKNVQPKVKGQYMEIYPVTFFRHEEYQDENPTDKPHFGTDLSWSPTSHTDIHITLNPDFGEVEADPFKVNLSKYKLYYEERRPFFVKGTEIFEIIPRVHGDFAPPMALFYSRQIGKKLLTGEEVPILFGAKIIEKRALWESGFLLARTNPRDGENGAFFSALRAKRQFLRNSTIGFYFGNKEVSLTGDYERVFSLDAVIRTRDTELKTIVAGLNKNNVRDRFIRLGLSHMGKRLFVNLGVVDIGDSFSLSGIGFVPYQGYKHWDFTLGPTFYPNRILRYAFLGVSTGQVKELGEPKRSWYSLFSFYLDFRNNWGALAELGGGKEYEYGNYYVDHKGSLSFWTDWTKKLYFSLSSGYDYGYYDYSTSVPTFKLAYQGWLSTGVTLRPAPPGIMRILFQRYIQYTAAKTIYEIVDIVRPQFRWTLTRNLSVSIYSEGVKKRSRGNFYRWRIGGTLAWMLAPKSWFYVAFNDLEKRDLSGRFKPKERIAVVKLRYLFFF